MPVMRITWTAVCRANNVTGASMPLRADLERIVLRIAQEEWNSTTMATRDLEAGGDSGRGWTVMLVANISGLMRDWRERCVSSSE